MVKDYTELNTVTPTTLFSRKLAEEVLKFGKKHKPFCEPCARLDFKDKVEAAEKESERRNGFVKMEDIKVDITSFSKYQDEKLFELIEDQEDIQDKVIEGSRTQVVIGHTLSYRCKARGHGISVFIPISEYNKMKKIKSEIKIG